MHDLLSCLSKNCLSHWCAELDTGEEVTQSLQGTEGLLEEKTSEPQTPDSMVQSQGSLLRIHQGVLSRVC